MNIETYHTKIALSSTYGKFNYLDSFRLQSHRIMSNCSPVMARYFWISDETGAKTGENLLSQINAQDKKTVRNRLILCRNLTRV